MIKKQLPKMLTQLLIGNLNTRTYYKNLRKELLQNLEGQLGQSIELPILQVDVFMKLNLVQLMAN